ncbi:MAG: ABC transporter permease [Clostridia bacterium]|nr:ABC transporter permease [Clostridia bacterium]
MNRFISYFRLQLKRSMKLFPCVLCVSAVLTAALAILLIGTVASNNDSIEKKKFNIGIVGDTSESYLGLGIAAVETLDSSNMAINFKEMTADDAEKSLEEGSLNAYVVIPEGFVEAAVHGDIKKITFVTTPGAVGFTTILKNEIATLISELLVHSQKGVYAVGDLMKDNGLKGRSDTMDAMATEYFALILKRADLYRTDIAGVSDSLSLGGYLLCGLPIFFLLMWGISCCFLFAKKNNALSRILSAKGSKNIVQISAEYLAYFLLMLVAVLIILLPVFSVLPSFSEFIPEFADRDFGFALSFILRLIPCIAVISALQFFICEAVNSMITGALAQFVSAIVLSYLGGCIYPIGFFPDVIAKLSNYTPGGAARSYMTSFIAGKDTSAALLVMAVWFVVFFTAAAAIRAMKIRSEDQ